MRDESTDQHSAAEYQKRRRSRAIVIFVTAMGLVGVAVAIVLVAVYGSAFTVAKPSARQLEGFTLDEVLTGKFYAESFNGTWISGQFVLNKSPEFFSSSPITYSHFFSSDHEFSYRSSQYGINIYDLKTSNASILVRPEIVVSFALTSPFARLLL